MLSAAAREAFNRVSLMFLSKTLVCSLHMNEEGMSYVISLNRRVIHEGECGWAQASSFDEDMRQLIRNSNLDPTHSSPQRFEVVYVTNIPGCERDGVKVALHLNDFCQTLSNIIAPNILLMQSSSNFSPLSL